MNPFVITTILTAALVPFMAGLLWARWRDPRRKEKRRALRSLREDRPQRQRTS